MKPLKEPGIQEVIKTHTLNWRTLGTPWPHLVYLLLSYSGKAEFLEKSHDNDYVSLCARL